MPLNPRRLELTKRGLDLLLEGLECAEDLGENPWSFAIEFRALAERQLSTSQLWWLIRKGYIEHRLELTSPGDNERTFRQMGMLGLCPKSCFVLTQAGAEFARNVDSSVENAQSSSDLAAAPRWDAVRRELWLGAEVVKRYRSPASNQECILAAFEASGWRRRIPDPLPPLKDLVKGMKRLHNTIQHLNKHQHRARIHFGGDGTGLGVRWELESELST
jgi:hypothetical protein